MIELSSVTGGELGLFLTLTKDLPATTSLAVFAASSGAMRAGIEGTITKVDFAEVEGRRVQPLLADQLFTVPGGETYRIAKAGDMPKAIRIDFDNGFNMTLGLLQQGGAKSTILFKGSTVPTATTDLNLGNIADKLLKKRFKCTKYYRDTTNKIVRINAGVESSYDANVYEFHETTV